MNDLIQNNLFFIIIFLLLIILSLIGVLVFVIFKLLANQKEQIIVHSLNESKKEEFPTDNIKELALKRLKEKKPDEVVEKFFCLNHKETASVGSCLICEDVFCENCLIEHEGLYFCREHFKIFANNKWVTITDIKTTPDNPEDGLYVWNFKRHTWKISSAPTFVLTHYKINVESDYIESYVQLNVIEKDAEKMKIELESFKNSGA